METFGQAHLRSAIVTRVTFLRPASRFGGPDAHLLPLSNTFISETCGYIFENGHLDAGKEDILEWVLDGGGGVVYGPTFALSLIEGKKGNRHLGALRTSDIIPGTPDNHHLTKYFHSTSSGC